MGKIRTWYMDTDILEKALDSCDLGDAYSAKVRMFPHKDMIDLLTEVLTYKDHQDIVQKLEERIKKLRAALEFYGLTTAIFDDDEHNCNDGLLIKVKKMILEMDDGKTARQALKQDDEALND